MGLVAENYGQGNWQARGPPEQGQSWCAPKFGFQVARDQGDLLVAVTSGLHENNPAEVEGVGSGQLINQGREADSQTV